MSEFELKISKKEISISLGLIFAIIASIFIINEFDFRNKKNATQELIAEIDKSAELDSILKIRFYEDTTLPSLHHLQQLVENLHYSEKLPQKILYDVDAFFPAGENRSDSCYHFEHYDRNRANSYLRSYNIINKTDFNRALAEGINWESINNKKDLNNLKSYHYNPDTKNLVIISYQLTN